MGLTIPGETSNYEFTGDNIDLGLGDSQATLGETPFNTTLTVTYRTAQGLKMNVTTNELTSIDDSSLSVSPGAVNLKCTNTLPAYGASQNESIEEIRQKALAFFTTQNRCVTKEDYEARSLNMPAKFGQISKIFVNRGDDLATLGDESADSNRINIYTLTYDNNKHLKTIQDHADGTPHPIKKNLKNYLTNFKILTDDIYITNGFIINFGVVFDVISHRNMNKQQVKFECIQKIKDYFNVDKMHFHQVIYTSDLVYELSSLDSVRAVNFVVMTQDFTLYNYSAESNNLDPLFCNDAQHTTIGECNTDVGGTSAYGWLYEFKQFYDNQTAAYKGSGIVLPAKTPSVFELKNPNKNIIGVVH